MIMLRVIEVNYGKADKRVELSELTSDGLNQIKFECQQMIGAIEDLEYEMREDGDN